MKPSKQNLDASADRLMDELIALRRRIHEHPELAFEEHETARRVQEFLSRLRIGFRSGIGGTGIVAMLEGAAPGPTIAIRADMDALPMSEPAGMPFSGFTIGRSLPQAPWAGIRRRSWHRPTLST